MQGSKTSPWISSGTLSLSSQPSSSMLIFHSVASHSLPFTLQLPHSTSPPPHHAVQLTLLKTPVIPGCQVQGECSCPDFAVFSAASDTDHSLPRCPHCNAGTPSLQVFPKWGIHPTGDRRIILDSTRPQAGPCALCKMLPSGFEPCLSMKWNVSSVVRL